MVLSEPVHSGRGAERTVTCRGGSTPGNDPPMHAHTREDGTLYVPEECDHRLCGRREARGVGRETALRTSEAACVRPRR